MNLIEAVKSGKPFTRQVWDSNSYIHLDEVGHLELSRADILAVDWTVEVDKVTITQAHLVTLLKEIANTAQLYDSIFKRLKEIAND